MWTTLFVLTVLFSIAVGVILTVHNQAEVVSAALVATTCVMIALGILPIALKVALLLTILLVEAWLLHRKLASGAASGASK